jgi:bifunctional DNA-binding transcriptional regulator/antitoxin component of YhaV-PrlF toxin-antitoxin module
LGVKTEKGIQEVSRDIVCDIGLNPPDFPPSDKRIHGLDKAMRNTFQVRVIRRGTITLPRELRDHNNIEEGDMLTLIDLGGVVVMSRLRSRVDEIADQLAKEWQASGESLESMLGTLRRVRAEYDTRKP